MNLASLGCLPLLLLPLACSTVDSSTHQDPAPHPEAAPQDHDDPFAQAQAVDAAQRDALLNAVKALEGRWTSEGGDTLFEITSAGSVVRETMMPGQEMEMVNMYSLDGNALRMTHYCGGGNQPHMVATQVDGKDIVFAANGVSDLKDSDQVYMGSMTLRLVDEDKLEQHWFSHTPDGVSGPMVFAYTRVD